jgi:hypothetical protein
MLELLEDAGGTLMRHTMRFPSQQVRDMLLASGLADGSSESYELLDELLRQPRNELFELAAAAAR